MRSKTSSTKTRSLKDEVAASDLAEADRLLIFDKLQDIETALLRATITGTADLARAADGLMGGVMRLYLRGVPVLTHPVTKGAMALAGALLLLVGAVADVSTIDSGPLAHLLGLPPPGGPPAPSP